MTEIKSEEDIMREKFTEILSSALSARNNSFVMSVEKYNRLIRDVNRVKNSGKKLPTDYWLTRRYDVLNVKGTDILIHSSTKDGNSVKYYVTEEELFDVLYSVHIGVGHGGRDKMLHEINKRYKNITQHQVTLFLQCCEGCQFKKTGAKRNTVKQESAQNKLVVLDSSDITRCQFDIIDSESRPDGNFKFILVHQDCSTKFINLRPLISKSPEEVASNLVDIFATFGAPCVIQSDIGKEFCNDVIENISDMWPEMQLVYGGFRQKQSLSSVKRSSQEVENMLITWMKDNSTTKWGDGLRFVQFMKNRSFYSAIKRSPFEAMFGNPPKLGLSSLPLPESVLRTLRTEEDLVDVMKNLNSENEKDSS